MLDYQNNPNVFAVGLKDSFWRAALGTFPLPAAPSPQPTATAQRSTLELPPKPSLSLTPALTLARTTVQRGAGLLPHLFPRGALRPHRLLGTVVLRVRARAGLGES